LSEDHTRTPSSVYLLLSFMVFVWSLNFIVVKFLLREFPPLALGALRITLAALMIAPYYVWHRMRHGLPLVDRGGFLALVGVGLLGVAANQFAFLLGLRRTSVSHAAMLFALTPMTVLLLSSRAGHEQISRNKILGILIAISGVALLQMRSPAGEASLEGDGLILMSMASFALFTVWSKSLRKDFDGIMINTFAYVGSAAALLPVTIWQTARNDFSGVSGWAWAVLFYLALVPSLVTSMIFYHGLRYLAPSRISMLTYLQPVLATAFAILLLGERMNAALIAGGALILAGVFIAERA
jgi:drug/metabolite transporter (DMT)-like permease